MFEYFGAKTKLLNLYPKPLYGSIIEPFAGSARYAAKHYNRDVWINDLYPVVFEVWRWIQQATPQDVRDIPEPQLGEDIEEVYSDLPQALRWLMGFCTASGPPTPNRKMRHRGARDRRVRNLKSRLLRIAGKIGHWKITNLPYDQLPNVCGTWYIDPPYQHQGTTYKFNQKGIDFTALGKWCQGRRGQVIVCEGKDADWLPFRPLYRVKSGRRNPYSEVIWTRCDKKVGFGFN